MNYEEQGLKRFLRINAKRPSPENMRAGYAYKITDNNFVCQVLHPSTRWYVKSQAKSFLVIFQSISLK